MTPSRRAALLAGLGLLPWPAFADPPHGRGNGHGGGNGRGHGGGPPGHRGGPPGHGHAHYLGGPELNVVQVWLGGNPRFYAQPLPPGMRNRLAQGKPLPPGIARRAVPHDLLVMLPPRPGYEYVMIGTSLVLVAVATGIVASVLTDALMRR